MFAISSIVTKTLFPFPFIIDSIFSNNVSISFIGVSPSKEKPNPLNEKLNDGFTKYFLIAPLSYNFAAIPSSIFNSGFTFRTIQSSKSSNSFFILLSITVLPEPLTPVRINTFCSFRDELKILRTLSFISSLLINCSGNTPNVNVNGFISSFKILS